MPPFLLPNTACMAFNKRSFMTKRKSVRNSDNRIVGTKQRIRRKCQKTKQNKTEIKSAFDEPLVDLTWTREKISEFEDRRKKYQY